MKFSDWVIPHLHTLKYIHHTKLLAYISKAGRTINPFIMFLGLTLCNASFCTVNGIVLFQILHIYTGAKGTNSSKKDNELKYRYLASSVSFLKNWYL